ncbi:3-ketoacyl-ACP reductase [Rossellomorea marisflavi]|uniref:3-ketoacyl-ACP reductase n=1 Tax=Rossellomorea marisflavi TaxID=189381 RepID=UPI00279E22FC|nr:3-ketoacyl-ACP reductase [Rossellomorea marisflavi]UTE71798.1 3-ketoacyl-ACP reductase [Rossellomorea marisflavi]
MAQSIEGKIAYITGAGRGIGKATALELAKAGVHLGLMARTESALEETAEEARTYGVEAVTASVDIADLSSVEAAVSSLQSALGDADILINNAGIGVYGEFLELEPAEWKRAFEVNVFGTYHVTRTVLPQLIEKNGGDIIMISSSSGLKGTAKSSAYCGSKFALQGFSESLMQEVRPHNIRVMTLNPSLVATDLTFGDKLKETDTSKYMQPEDLAEHMVSLLKLDRRIFIKQSLQWATNPF